MNKLVILIIFLGHNITGTLYFEPPKMDDILDIWGLKIAESTVPPVVIPQR